MADQTDPGAAGTTTETTDSGAAPEGAAGASGGGEAAAGAQQAAGQDGTTEAAKAGPPETYTLKLPDDSALDATALERTAATARALGLSNDAAQTALEFVASEVAAQRAALLEAHQPGGAAWTTQVEAWKAETLADPTLGKTPEERTAAAKRGEAVVLKYAEQRPEDAEAMKEFLNTSGLGNHPAAVRFFAWIGHAMSEGSMVIPGSQGGGERSAAQVLYGNSHTTTE